MAERHITVKQGETFDWTTTYYPNAAISDDGKITYGTAQNLTGWTARMQIRRSYKASDTLVSLTSSAGITLGGSAGTVQVVIDATTTAGLPVCPPEDPAVYDIELVDGSGKVKRYLEGKVVITPEVTR